jgi:hypothetical protein
VITASANGLHVSGSVSAWGEVKVGKLREKFKISSSFDDHGFEFKTPFHLPHHKHAHHKVSHHKASKHKVSHHKVKR